MDSIHTPNRSSPENRECIWMQAGIVRKRYCQADYLCSECRFDRMLQRTVEKNRKQKQEGNILKGKKGEIVSWKEKLHGLPPTQQPCIHHMKKRIEFRTCTNEYNCGNCEFDQFFYDQYAVHAVVEPVEVIDIEGFKVPQGYYLHYGHTWAKLESGSMVRIGIDDFALRVLGPPDSIKIPLMGKTIQQNRAGIVFNRRKNQAEILSPISGVVTDVNPRLVEMDSGLPAMDPYSEGWVLRVHSKSLRNDLKKLMIADETENFLKKEVDHLYQAIEEAVPLAADGGQLAGDLFGNMPQLNWNKLTKLFLHT